MPWGPRTAPRWWWGIASAPGWTVGCGTTSTGFGNDGGNGVDGGIKIGYQGFEGVLYGYTGSGLGTTGLFILPTSAAGGKRDSDGGYLQATYKFEKLKVGDRLLATYVEAVAIKLEKAKKK